MKELGYRYKDGRYVLRILPYSDKIIRVTYGKEEGFPKSSLIVTAEQPKKWIGEATEEASYFQIRTAYLALKIDKETLSIQYERIGKKLPAAVHGGTAGVLLSAESERMPREMEKYDIYRTVGQTASERITVDGIKASVLGGRHEFVRSAYHAKISLAFSETEAVFGLGSHEEGYPDIRGRFLPLYQENMRIAVPYLVSSLGYAYLFDCTSMMAFDDRDGKGIMYFDSVDAMDYYFIAGDDFDDICRGYRWLTGATPMLPKWAVGYAQSKERYASAKELIETVEEYRKREIPLDLIVQDWRYWKDSAWGEKIFDPARYPDLAGLTAKLHQMGAHLMVSIWPNMSGESENRLEFAAAGKLLNDGTVYNAFDEEARRMYWKQANEGIFRYGTDAWWCDCSEPFDAVWQGGERPEQFAAMKLSVEEFKKNIDDGLVNAYSLFHSMGIYEGQRKEEFRTSDKKNTGKRVLNLTRSGYAGQHRYGTIVWSGDISASWETLRRQVHIMQNYIACGEAYWNSDIGAFFVKKGSQWFWRGEYEDGCKEEGYRELYTRWMQFAVFTPMLRSHGTDTPREIWNFGEPGSQFYEAIKKAIQLRYSLVPYFYSLHAAVTFEGTMPVRPLALAFPEDAAARRWTKEYMYGHEFLVCPVTEQMGSASGEESLQMSIPRSVQGIGNISGEERTEGKPEKVKTMEVYLPGGGWYDFYTEEYYEGGQTLYVELSIDRIPLFVRAGSIVPKVEVMQYVDEKPDAPYEILVYSGADGEFTLYDDDGDGYGYEDGYYAKTCIHYDNAMNKVSEQVAGCPEYQHKMHYRIVGREN